MRELKREFHEAKAAYDTIRYPGDLPRELLYAERRRALVIGAWWAAGMTGVIAATIGVAVWLHRAEQGKKIVRLPSGPVSQPVPPSPGPKYVETFKAIRAVPVSAYVMDVRSGMRQAVDQIAMGMDGAVESPVVKGSVRTVQHLTSEIEDAIKPIGERLTPRFQ